MNEGNKVCCESGDACTTTAIQTRPVNVYRPYHTSCYDEAAWEVAVRLPGAKREEVLVTVENDLLEVKAIRHLETPASWRSLGNDESEKHWHLRLDVGPEVDESRISGSLEDGILTLRLPLREEVKSRTIEIR